MAFQDKLTFLFYDQSNERTSINLSVDTIDETTLPNIESASNTLKTALEGIILATASKRTISAFTRYVNPTKAGNRELKWLIRVVDTTTGEPFSHEIGCADPSAPVINQGGITLLDPASAEWTALGTAISNASFITKSGHNMTLVSVELVGRNL